MLVPPTPRQTRRFRLGELLTGLGVITEEILETALLDSSDGTIRLGELLLQRGLVPKEQLSTALETALGVPYLNCGEKEAEPEALSQISKDVALRYCCIPLAIRGRELTVVLSEPQNLRTLNDLQFVSGMRISPRLGFQEEILGAIGRYYSDTNSTLSDLSKDVDAGKQATDCDDIEFITTSSRQQTKDAIKEFQASLRRRPTPAVRLVSEIFFAASDKKASDIHIDPQIAETVVRLRVDGILRDITTVPRQHSAQLVSRIKILSDLDIAERRAPQDGRFLVRIGHRKLDVRVSTLPTHNGEKVVMRLLEQDSASAKFSNLGFTEEDSDALAATLSLPQGLILVCGPTGSGKSTTLYSALHQLSGRSVNVITVEDPIEYMVDGICQVQVNRKAGLTFASCLRSILRQDPNIIMVGEIRDKETAEIALTAAQTGHLVLSTLHTVDSIAAIDRLRDLGVPAYLIASSITAIVSQRLLRKYCECRSQALDHAPETETFAAQQRMSIRQGNSSGAGCPACDNTGYKGRVGAFEVLIITDEIRRMIQHNAGTNEIRSLLAASGMQFLRDDAIEKVRLDLTSMEEMLRVIPTQESSSFVCQGCGKEQLANFAFCPYCGEKIHKLSPVGTHSINRQSFLHRGSKLSM